MTIDETLKTVNPNYSKDRSYRVNCQRVVVAAELARRGYRVEAQPKTQNWDYLSGDGWRHYFVGQTSETIGRTQVAVERGIESRMSSWGDGARAIIRVRWKGTKHNSGHVFQIEREKGKTVAYDAQSGKRIKLTDYLHFAMPSYTEISRLDHLTTPTRSVVDAVTARGS